VEDYRKKIVETMRTLDVNGVISLKRGSDILVR
jgi:hypothetical protein